MSKSRRVSVTHHRGAYLKRFLGDAGALGSSALAPARSGDGRWEGACGLPADGLREGSE